MEQGPLEDIVSALPNDLADFVSNDNKSFLVEKEKWTAEQEKMGKIRKQKQKDDLEEDLEVVAERLTYVNTHAALTYQGMHYLSHWISKIMFFFYFRTEFKKKSFPLSVI